MPIALAENAFCTVDDVKAAIGNSNLVSDVDDTITIYINYFSQFVETECDRLFVKKYREVMFNGVLPVPGGVRSRLFCKAIPIDRFETIQVWDDPTREFTDPKYLLLKNYDYNVDYLSGVIKLYPYSYYNRSCYGFSLDSDNVRVDYIGGVIDNGAVPWDLRGAAAQQSAHWWRIANDPGASQISSVGGGQVTMYSPTQILPAVKNVIGNYRRMEY